MAHRDETKTVRVKSKNYEAVRKLAHSESRNVVDQMDIVVQAGLSSLKK